MSKVISFNSGTCRVTSDKIIEALQPVAEELGISIQRGRGSYSSDSFTLQVVCATRNTDGTVNTPEAEAFKLYAKQLGMEPTDLHREINLNGELVRIVGLKPRSRKYPILGKKLDGRTFKYTVGSVRHALGYKPDPLYDGFYG